MSSHHIVRDEQEPALFIQELDAIPREVLGDLLEWSPTVMITSDQVDGALGMGFRIDVVLCPARELEGLKSKLLHQSPLRFLTVPSYEQSINEGLHYFVAAKYKGVNLITKFCQRLAEQLVGSLVPITIFDHNFKWHLVNRRFKKWVSQGHLFRTIVSDYSVNSPLAAKTKYTGGYYEFSLDGEGFIEISHSNPFWLGEKVVRP